MDTEAKEDVVAVVEVRARDFKGWHVSPYHIVAAESACSALSHAILIGIDASDGLYSAAIELDQTDLALPCSTGDNQGNPWRDGTISTFLAEVSETRLLCEVCPRPIQ